MGDIEQGNNAHYVSIEKKANGKNLTDVTEEEALKECVKRGLILKNEQEMSLPQQKQLGVSWYQTVPSCTNGGTLL